MAESSFFLHSDGWIRYIIFNILRSKMGPVTHSREKGYDPKNGSREKGDEQKPVGRGKK